MAFQFVTVILVLVCLAGAVRLYNSPMRLFGFAGGLLVLRTWYERLAATPKDIADVEQEREVGLAGK